MGKETPERIYTEGLTLAILHEMGYCLIVLYDYLFLTGEIKVCSLNFAQAKTV
jgi:hypothetical protein